METTSDPTKILEKGPEYLRKQMELESETTGRMSAVERLAASRKKYVKSQQAASSTQDSMINFGSASVSSTDSSNWSSKRGGNLVTVNNSSEATQCGEEENDLPGVVRRSSSRKRDSLLIYRQKCDLMKGSASGRRRTHIQRRQMYRSARRNVSLPEAADKGSEAEENNEEEITTPEATAKECSSPVGTSQTESTRNREGEEEEEQQKSTKKVVVNKSSGLLTVPEVERRPGKGVARSHSDISSRYSKSFADFDAFFKYCGLDAPVVETLGKENFSARSDDIVVNIRSISISTSEDGFSRTSGDSDGLMEEKLHNKIRQTTSVIERNARIIKWLYSCRNAKETGKKLRDLD